MTEPPVLRVVAGGVPTDEETAALTAVLAAAASTKPDEHEPSRAHSRWRDSARPAAFRARTGWLADARRSAQRL